MCNFQIHYFHEHFPCYLLPSGEWHRILLIRQHCFGRWLGAVRHQAIAKTNVDETMTHMASSGHDELNSYLNLMDELWGFYLWVFWRKWFIDHLITGLRCVMLIRRTRQIWGIWKLRPAYSPETPNLGQNRWCFVPCDLEIWWMTLENNRAPLLCCFKLCATFHSHRWIQTGVADRKRPIWVKFDDF